MPETEKCFIRLSRKQIPKTRLFKKREIYYDLDPFPARSREIWNDFGVCSYRYGEKYDWNFEDSRSIQAGSPDGWDHCAFKSVHVNSAKYTSYIFFWKSNDIHNWRIFTSRKCVHPIRAYILIYVMYIRICKLNRINECMNWMAHVFITNHSCSQNDDSSIFIYTGFLWRI